tara:strand:+ start:299 stop:493 length:195 start_codon:yes stop_codon:yes gene_type:complete
MKNKLVSAFLVLLTLGIGIIQSGWFGSLALTQKVHGFVNGIGDDGKVGGVIRTLIIYAGWAVPA